MKNLLMIAGLVLGMATTAMAQPVVDGSLDAAGYGAALSTQNTRTQFGDASNPDALLAGGGSEIDQVFATISGGRLHVLVTGNLEDNFNKLTFFFDTNSSTGVNTLDGDNLPLGLDSFCCGGLGATGALQRMDGLGFDAGFKADYSLIVTQGREKVNPGAGDELEFFASSAHFADLTNGVSGASGGLGMQLAPRGLPNVLRGPGDYNNDGTNNAADYTLWRDSQGDVVANGTGADGDASGTIDAGDFSAWADNFNRSTTLSADAFAPGGSPGNTEALIAASLPGLSQGELIDRTYAQSVNGGCTDDTGAGCVAKELEFALDVDPLEIATNASSHRNFDNFVDLRLAVDNSNIAGVLGNGATATDPDEFATVVGEDDPAAVTTGIEFSIPLSEIGATAGSGNDIRLLAFVNGGGHDFISNQLSGAGNLGDSGFGLPRGNLGTSFFNDGIDPPLFTMVDLPGDQFVTISNPGVSTSVPEPGTLALLGMVLRDSAYCVVVA